MTKKTRPCLLAVLVCSMLSVFIAGPASAISSREYPYLYKSPRALGMGGVNVAIGGAVDALFYNPAGLSMMPKDDWEFSLLRLTGEVGENVTDFSSDLTDSFDVGNLDNDPDGDATDDQMRAMNDVLAKYRGKNMHLRLSNLSTLGVNGENIAFGFGGLANIRLDALTHQGFSSDGFLEMNTELQYGGLLGFSYTKHEGEGLSTGFSLKYIKSESLKHNFTATELVDNQDDIEDFIMNDLRKSGSGIGLDFGTIYRYNEDSYWRPTAGVSVLNAGGLYMGEAGMIPMTVNVGVAARPKISFFNSATIGLDYVDLFNGYADNDIGKRLRLGGEVILFDILPLSLALRGGLYQGYPSYGADFRLLIFNFSYLNYSEEIGAYAGQEKDTRQLVMLNVGW